MELYNVKVYLDNFDSDIQAGTLTSAGICISVEDRALSGFKYLIRQNINKSGIWHSKANLKIYTVKLERRINSVPELYTASPELVLRLCSDFGVESILNGIATVSDEYFDVVRDCSYPSHHKCYCTSPDQCQYLIAIPKQHDEPENDVSQEALWKEVDTIIEEDMEEFAKSELSSEEDYERMQRLLPKLMEKFIIERK